MKKQYNSPTIRMRVIEDVLLQTVSKTQIEGTTPHTPTGDSSIPVDGTGNSTGEGMGGAKGGGFFYDGEW